MIEKLQERVIKFNVENKIIEFVVFGETFYGEDEILLDNEIDLTANTSFRDTGFACVPFLSKENNEKIREGFRKLIFDLASEFDEFKISYNDFLLEDYHNYVNDEIHYSIVNNLKKGLSADFFPIDISIVEQRMSEICNIGPLSSYLNEFKSKTFSFRIVRPGVNESNPPHRDVWLDRLKNAINIYFPIAGSSIDSSLPLVLGSHRWKESEIERTTKGAVTKNLQYSVPTVTGSLREIKMIRPQPQENEVLVFSPYLIHGGAYNFQNNKTRVSLEARFWKAPNNA